MCNSLWDIPLNTSDIEQSILNIENKTRSNPLTWKGQFSPQFIEAMLSTYANKEDAVLDPFVGSGTVLYEAAKIGLHSIGVEINPAAFLLAQTYLFCQVDYNQRNALLNQAEKLFITALNDNSNPKWSLLKALENSPNNFIEILLNTLIILSDFYKNPSVDKVIGVWTKLKNVIYELPFTDANISVINSDARQIPVKDNSVDIVITSPPYINVFNYHQQYRQSAEYLGWNLLSVAKSEIGSNRKHRGNRFLTVIQYCLDLSQIITEIKRVCKPNSRIVFVMGRESTVRGTTFKNGEIMALLGIRCGKIKIINRQERVFLNRFGISIKEDIIHFQNSKQEDEGNIEEKSRLTALEILEKAIDTAPEESISDIEDAIKKIHLVKPSPIFKIEQSKMQIGGYHNDISNATS